MASHWFGGVLGDVLSGFPGGGFLSFPKIVRFPCEQLGRQISLDRFNAGNSIGRLWSRAGAGRRRAYGGTKSLSPEHSGRHVQVGPWTGPVTEALGKVGPGQGGPGGSCWVKAGREAPLWRGSPGEGTPFVEGTLLWRGSPWEGRLGFRLQGCGLGWVLSSSPSAS